MKDTSIQQNSTKKKADEVWCALVGRPVAVRAIFEAYHYSAPWLGWVPMLCEILRDVQTGHKPDKRAP